MISRARHLARRHWPLPLVLGVAALTAAPFLGDHSRKIDFVAQFLIQAAALTVVAGLLLLLLRRRLAATVAGLCLLLQLAVLQPAFIPARATADPGQRLTVVYANIWTANQQLAELAAAIGALGPDVVVLSEVRPGNDRILDALADAYPHRADCLTHWACDTVVLSRLPLLVDRSMARSGSRVAMAAASIETAFGPVTVAGTHLDRPLPPSRLLVQETQTAALAELLDAVDEPLLVVGDFNSAPWGRLLRGFAAATGLAVAPGLEGTWPAALPWPLRLPIDQALTGRGLGLVEREVIRLPGSDHRALRLEVAPAAS